MEIKVSIILYLVFVPAAFFFGPVDWQVDNPVTVAVYWGVIVLSIVLAWLMFSYICQGSANNLGGGEAKRVQGVGWVWFSLAVAFIYLKSMQMTGLSLIEGLAMVTKSANESYAEMVRYSLNRSSNPMLSLGVAVLSLPFWAGLFFLLKNKGISYRRGKLVFLLLLYSFFVMMKGADKEILEVVLFILLFYFFDGRFRRGGKKIVVGFVVIAFVSLVAIRKLNRSAEDICFYLYCLGEDSTILEEAFALLVGYSVQGLKGLSVALDGAFFRQPELCISPMVSSFVNKITGGCQGNGAVVELIESSGVWTSKGQWISLPVWLSSLGGFWVVPFILFLHALIFCFALGSKERMKSDFFFFVFVFYSMIYFIYLPANNQVFLTADSLLLFVVSFFYVGVNFIRSVKWVR
jgi:hypothetical protein